MSEQKIREEMLKGKDGIFLGGEAPRLLNALRKIYPGLGKAFVLHYIPEQDADIYDVLVDKDTVINIEINNNNNNNNNNLFYKFKIFDVNCYSLKNKSRIKNIKLMVAIDLMGLTD
ncbi:MULTISPECIES: hypothetical protein [Cupriavidus]